MTLDRRARLLRLARLRNDRAALAMLEGGRRYTPDPADYLMWTARLGRAAA